MCLYLYLFLYLNCAFRFSLSKAEMKQLIAYLPDILQKYPSTSPQPNALQCPYPLTVACTIDAHYRTYDGRCNNLQRPLWGSSHHPLARFLEPDYADGNPQCYAEILNIHRIIIDTVQSDTWKYSKCRLAKTKQQLLLLLQWLSLLFLSTHRK